MAIVAIGLVLGIGSGVFAGLGSTAAWRRQSNDASFASLSMHDLRVTLSPGTFVDEGSLLNVIGAIEDAGEVTAAAERLVVDSQADTGGADSILVPARVVGMSFESADPVDEVWVSEGTAPAGGEGAASSAVLEAKFADDRALPITGSLTVAGGHIVAYSGLGMSPEDFFYEGPEGTIFAEGELAIIYVPLAMAQDIAGRPGAVNDLVLTLEAGTDNNKVAAQIGTAMSGTDFGATISTREEADAVRVLYEDIDNDQQFWNALSALVVGAAALAAFNLISRIVEAQRREIGIGMALGVPRRRLAIRPLLIGAQVAILGAVAGAAFGIVIGNAFGALLESFLPLPIYRRDFQFGVYAQGVAIALTIPLLAAAIPVYRALRVEPIEAIRTGHLAAKSSRLTDWTARLRLPGSTLTLMPIRNIVRNPRRAILTALGVGAAITALVAVLGMLDSFNRTLDQGATELTKGDQDRITVQLDTFYPSDSSVVDNVRAVPVIGRVDAGLRLPVSALLGQTDDHVDLLLEFVDLGDAAWSPTLVEGAITQSDGLVLARKAADDLDVAVGETVKLRHPVRTDPTTFTVIEGNFTVDAIHANPIRTFAFIDLAGAERFGLDNTINLLQTYPVESASPSDVQRAIFGLPGIGSSQPVARIGEAIDRALDQFLGFFLITSAAVVVLALLISFNASRITVEEREREHATMRAFGLPVRAVVGAIVKESVIVGVAATAIGIAAGAVFLQWMLTSLANTTLPDVGIGFFLSPTTIAVAALVGIAAVAVAPLFLVGRLRRMDLPGSLRIME